MKPLNGLLLALLFFGTANFDNARSQELVTGIQPVTQNAITYVSGGTGQDEQQAMAGMRKDYDLHATFAIKKTGEYLANVGVTIQNAKGEKIFDAGSLGPLFFAKVPPGQYKFTANSGGKAQVQSIVLKKNGVKDLYFYWDSE